MPNDHCICAEWDESGLSVCGLPCPIHNKEIECDFCHGWFKKDQAVNYHWCSERCYNRGNKE
jgi:hypothetical protein